jgi:uncharacterized membrane protein
MDKMKARAEIKAQARSGFTQKYWPVVGIALLGMLIVWAVNYIPAVGGIIYLLVGLIIVVGLNGFFISVYRGNELKVESLFSPFNRYGRVLGGMLWMYLWLFIWALIFIVPMIIVGVAGFANAFAHAGPAALQSYGPAQMGMMNGYGYGGMQGWGAMVPYFNNMPFLNGLGAFFLNPLWLLLFLLLGPVIVKAYSFFCTPYILADSPDVHATDAIRLSSKIMAGYKWKLFVTQLTFIGWFLLCGITAGILWIFYVGPYYNATMAGFYEEVKNNAKEKGIEGMEILN